MTLHVLGRTAPCSTRHRLLPSVQALSLLRMQPCRWGRRAGQHRQRRLGSLQGRCRQLTVAAGLWGAGDEHQWDDQVADRRKVLLNFVQEVQPGVMQKFEDAAEPQVVTAMRQTITNILGTLPPQFFRVTISTAGENLAQLLYSVIMTGYMFRNAWYRLELRKSLGALPADRSVAAAELVGVTDSMDGGDDGYRGAQQQYAPGSQKRGVQGEVVRWVVDSGPEVTPAVQYIESLEREVASLRRQIAEQATALSVLSSNELVDYLKTLDAGQLQELTSCAGEDVLEAMNTFIQRLMATEEEDWKSGSSDCTAVELAQLLYWCAVVGYQLRMLEVRLDMRSQFELPGTAGSSSSFLPPGR